MNKDLEIMNHTMQNWMKDSEKYSDDLFHFQAEGKEWSLQQVLLHNSQIQDLVEGVLKKNLNKQDELRDTKLKTWYRYFMLKLALASSKKFKVPKVISSIENTYSLAEIRDNWNQSYKRLDELLKNFPKNLESKLIFRHPVIGWININQTLGFMLAHMKHHQKQIESLYLQLDSKMK
jgi:hypothetical protein